MSNSRRIVIDDSDPSVEYAGSWSSDPGTQDALGTFGATYLHTEHGTHANNSFAFSFAGTSITVYGTTALQAPGSPLYDPSWECFVDGKSIGNSTRLLFPENNWILCDHSALDDGPHLLTLNVTTMGATFWFDYLEFTPPNTSYGTDTSVWNVSVTDPAIEYGAGWGSLGNVANFTTAPGSKATFNFTGTSLTWMGFIPTELSHNASSANYSIDGGQPTTFSLNGLPANAPSTVYHQVLFTIPELQPGPHSLVVTYLGNGSQTPLVLSNILLTNTSSSSPSQSSSPSSNSTKHSSSSRTGAIAGGVVGGVLGFLIFLTLLILFLRRRQQEQHKNDVTNPSHPEIAPYMSSSILSSPPPPPLQPSSSTPIVPFLRMPASDLTPYQNFDPYSNNNLTSTKSKPLLTHTLAASSSSSSAPRNRGDSVSAPTIPQPSAGGEPQPLVQTPGQETASMNLTPVDAIVHRHEDSGLRMTDGAIRLELPPVYTVT